MAVTGVVLVALAASAEVEDVLKIIIGEEVVEGIVVAHDEKGFTLRPTDAATSVRISWSVLSPGERERVKKLIGRAADEERTEAPVDMVDAVVLVLPNGRRLTGILLPERETEDEIFIRNSRMSIGVRRRDVVSIEKVKLPATEVYGPDELYGDVLAEIEPVSARDHFEVARRCMKLGLYEKARLHLTQCTIIDPRYGERTEDMLAELELRIGEARALALNEAVLRAKAAGNHGEMLSLIDRLRRAFPGSPYTTPWVFERPEIEARLREVLERKLVSAGYAKLDELIRRKVWGRVPDGEVQTGIVAFLKDGKAVRGKLVEETPQLVIIRSGDDVHRIPRERVSEIRPVTLGSAKTREATFAECREYVTDGEGGITADLKAALLKQFRMGEDEVAKIWNGRSERGIFHGERPTVKPRLAQDHEASYGQGTWLRGDSYGVDVGPSGVDVHGPGSGLEEDVENWWSRLPRESRYRILEAFCAEATMQVVRKLRDRCRECGGGGYRRVHGVPGPSTRRTCPRCRGLGYALRLIYR